MMTRFYRWVIPALCILFVTGIAWADLQWVSFTNSEEAAPSRQVLEHNNLQTVIEVSLNGFWVDEVMEAGVTYQVPSLGGWATTMDVGAPMLPMINERVGIPARSDLRVHVTNVKTVTFSDYNLYPFQTPTTDDTQQLPFVLDQAAYSQNEFYPGELATVSQPHIWRDVRLTELHMSPMRYNPATKELVVATSFEVVIEYHGINNHNALDRAPVKVNPRIAEMYRAGLINYDYMGIDETRLDEPGTKYLFVMKAEAQPYVQPLIDYRNAQGYQTEVRHMESPNFDDEYEIKDYINDLFFASGLEYVLLVGDAFYSGGPSAVDVPMHYWTNTYSDSWYISLQGDNDYYADLTIGRIVYDTAADLEHQITKTMDYLTAPDTSTDWAKNSLLVAHQEQYPLKYTQCKEEIRTFPYALETPTFGQAYGGAGATNNQVINMINTLGTGLLNYRGHGSQTDWWQWGASGGFNASHIYQLTNFDQYFVHYDVCCDNMDFPGYNGDCFAESMMKAPAAAIAVHSAIVPSYTIPNHDYDKEFYKGLYNEGLWNIGYAQNFANVTVINNHGGLGQSNYRTYLWLGDACIDLWTDTPQPLAISHANVVNLATEEFTVTVTMNSSPVENALVCAQSDYAYARGWSDASGVAHLVFSELPETTTDVTITATSHNGLAVTGTCTVIPTTSPYSLYVLNNPISGTVIPPTGGTLNYHAELRNDETYYMDIQVWSDWIYPDQTIHEPFINRNVNLTPGNLVQRDLTLSVSGSEPAGTYTYRLCLGTYQGGAIYEMDTFDFEKTAPDGWLGEPGQWVTESGSTPWEDEVGLEATLLPQEYSLSEYPNPFNPETTITYALPVDAQVKLTIYNTMGQEVAVLVDGFRNAGVQDVTFDASNFPSGVYISDLNANETHLTSKLVLLK
ncbi:hypothetical protein CEE37_03935 [candidate division LCP-89 bacterium B3_LCP]|uniref:Gingipain R n=1 Tax=candidate division LCP-89 bacterium B3_LCP TaxID=2012998 RepID=A0A532V409_UNCL8|nr:MAG: hypothetical protein CEE37_03935 [candidate division LCP-89 bacterium B3_LCP]